MDEPIRSKLVRLRVPLGRGTWYNSALDLVQGESITFRLPHVQPGSNGDADPDPSGDWLTGRIGSGGQAFSITDGFTMQVDWPGTLELQADSNHAIRHTHFTLAVHRNGRVQSASERPVLDCGGTGGVLVPTYRPLLGQISVYAWVKPRSLKPGAVIVSDWAAASNCDYLQRFELGLNAAGCLSIKIDSSNPRRTGPVLTYSRNQQLALDSWRLVGFNFDGNTLTVANGESFESTILSIEPWELGKPDTAYRKLGIGCDPETSEDAKAQRAWDGQIAEVSIWSRALTYDEQQQMLSDSLAQGNLDNPLSFWQPDQALRHYWALKDGTGEAVDDATLRAPGDTYGKTTWVRDNLPLQRIVSKVVSGRGMWQSTGVVLHKMSEKSVLLQPVQGVVSADKSASSADSDEDPTLDGDNLVPDLPTGALVGRIGDTVFYVSDGYDEYITKIPADAVGPLLLAFNDSLKNRKNNNRQVGILAIVSPDVQGVFINSDAVSHNSGGRANLLAQARAHVTRKINAAHEQAHETIQDAHARAQDLKQTTTAVSNIKNGLSKFLVFAQSDGSIGLLESATGFRATDTVNKVQIKPNLMPEPIPALGLTVDSTKGLLYFWQSPGPDSFQLIKSSLSGTDQEEVATVEMSSDPLSIISVFEHGGDEHNSLHKIQTDRLRPGASRNSVSLVVARTRSYEHDTDIRNMFPDIELQQGADPRALGPVTASDIANETWAVWWAGTLHRVSKGVQEYPIKVAEAWKGIASDAKYKIGQRTPFGGTPIGMFLDEGRGSIYWLFGTGYSLDGYSSTSGLLMGLLVTDSHGAPIADPILYPLGLARWQATELGWTTDLGAQKDVHKLPVCPLAEREKVGIVESLVVDTLSGWAYTFLRVRSSAATQASTLLLPLRTDQPIISAAVKLYDYDITQQPIGYDNKSRNSPDFMGFTNSSPYIKYESLNTQKAAQHAGLVLQYQQAVLKKDSAIADKRQDVQRRLSAKQQEQAKKHDEAQKAHADASALHQKRIDDTKAKLTTTQNTKTAKINAAKEKAASDKANAQAQKDQKVQSERAKAYATHVTPRQNDLDNARKERDKKR